VRTAAALVVAVLAVVATVSSLGAGQAVASTLNGVATVADPGTTTPLLSGGSDTQFTLALPAGAACTGDTASHGYHIYSYLVQKGTDLSTVTFNQHPSQGFGLFDSTGSYYGPVNTAVTTGQIPTLPNNFEWGPFVAAHSVLSQFLYTGGTSGVWEGGLVCANTSGVVTDNWNTEITFTASGSDPNGFVWSAVPGPSGSAPAVFTSASSTTFTEGTSNTFTPTASGSPTPTITESGALPAGVSFTGGSLTGTPTAGGTFPITFTATNGIESPAVQSFTLTVGAAQVAPTFTSATSTTFPAPPRPPSPSPAPCPPGSPSPVAP
jgi:hypothetical protein